MQECLLNRLNELESILKDASHELSTGNVNLTVFNDSLKSLKSSIEWLKRRASAEGAFSIGEKLEFYNRLNRIISQHKSLGKEVRARIKKAGVPTTNITRIKRDSPQVIYERLCKLDISAILLLGNSLNVESKSSRVVLSDAKRLVVSNSVTCGILFNLIDELIKCNKVKVISFIKLVKHYLIKYYIEVHHRELSINCLAVNRYSLEVVSGILNKSKVR